MLTRIDTTIGETTTKGMQYKVASGSLIPNLREKKFMAVDSNGLERHMVSQVCDVNKPLLSVSKIVQEGNKVVFSKMGSFVEDETSGEKMYMREAGGMYLVKLWVKKPF